MGLISLYFYSICLCGTNENYGRGKFPGVNTPMVLSLVLGGKSVGRDLKYRVKISTEFRGILRVFVNFAGFRGFT